MKCLLINAYPNCVLLQYIDVESNEPGLLRAFSLAGCGADAEAAILTTMHLVVVPCAEFAAKFWKKTPLYPKSLLRTPRADNHPSWVSLCVQPAQGQLVVA